VLSNCVNSGIRQISILTQYKAQSLIQHVQHGWSYLRGEFGEFVEVVPAQQQLGPLWYRGTADAVHQNIELILAHRPKHVLVLAGDHIYKMDYGPMIAYHVEKGADITVGVVEVPALESRHYGVLTATEWNRVTKFSEKPATPDTLPTRPDTILASMGIYVFNTRLLETLLAEDAANESSGHDFGKNILPVAIDSNRQVFAYPFQDVKTRAQSYWRDVGTVDAYYDANLELVHVRPELNIYDEDWPIWTYQVQQPPAKFVLDEEGRRGSAVNSMVSGGCIISGAVVRESLLFSDVRVEERSSIFRSVILPHAEIGRGCVIRGAIVDEGCEIPDGTTIGVDREADARRFHVTEKGVVLVTPDMLRARRGTAR
jgi:glucose-1-phosphate adenylyltransferase